MKEKKKFSVIKDLAYYSSLGFSVALSIFIGLFVGVWLDKKTGYSPLFTLVFLGLGIVAGFRNIFIAMKKSKDLK